MNRQAKPGLVLPAFPPRVGPRPRVGVLVGVFGLLALALAPVSVQAHGTFVAQELEIHLLNDEGTDTIEPYGGYDITEVFVGSAYVPGLGDTAYLRLELYGEFSDVTAAMPWSVEVELPSNLDPRVYRITTADGENFESDFAALEVEVEPAEHAVHVRRATLPPTEGFAPGVPLPDITVRSYWGSDLRDVAPGGIPVPFTQGRQEYDDPTAIPGVGRIATNVTVPSTRAYFGGINATRDGNAITLFVDNGLAEGGQHVMLDVATLGNWNFSPVAVSQEVEGGKAAKLEFMAVPDAQSNPLVLELTSDVGGHAFVVMERNGTLFDDTGKVVLKAIPEPVEATPAPTVVAVGLAVGVALVVRRRVSN